jgi:hypothetical protein
VRYHLLQQLNALCPNFRSPANIDAYPSDVAARSCEAGNNAELDWSAEDPDDWNCAGGRFKIEHKEGGESDDQIWIPTHYLASEFRIMMRCNTSFAGIALDQEIAPFDIA